MFIKKVIKYILLRLKFRKTCTFDYSCNVGKTSLFEGANKIYPNTCFCGTLGYGSYIASNCEITANIGRFTSVAPHERTNHAIHPYTYPHATTCPMFFSLMKQNGVTFADKQMLKEFVSKTKIYQYVYGNAVPEVLKPNYVFRYYCHKLLKKLASIFK